MRERPTWFPRGIATSTPPTQIAEDFSRLEPTERAARFRLLDKDSAAEVFDSLDAGQQRELIEALRSPEVQRLMEDMEPDDRVRLLDEMPAVVARQLVGELSGPERELTNLLLGYPPESAGRIMTPEFVELRPEATVAEALATIRRKGPGVEALYVLPVRGAVRRLEGVVDLTELVLADPEARVEEVMSTDHPYVSAYDDQEAVARLIGEQDLIAVPVVDREQRLVGMVTFDDAMEVIEREETEDRAREGATEPIGLPYHAVSVRRIVRARIVWLLFLVVAASFTVSVLGAFEATLESVVTLALFIPLLIGTGGNCGAQAATTITRALAVGDVRFADLPATVFKELRVGLSVGLLFGLLSFPVVSVIWDAQLAATISITLLAICTWATTVGASLPLISSKLGIDPAVVSAPFVTILVDVTGLLIYFLVAELLLL